MVAEAATAEAADPEAWTQDTKIPTLKTMHTVPLLVPHRPVIPILQWGQVMSHVVGQGVCTVCLPEGLGILMKDFTHALLGYR